MEQPGYFSFSCLLENVSLSVVPLTGRVYVAGNRERICHSIPSLSRCRATRFRFPVVASGPLLRLVWVM